MPWPAVDASGSRSGLTRPTGLAIVNELLASGTIVETGPDSRPGALGRPGVLLAFNARVLLTAACEIQDTTVDVVLADANGVILHESTAPLDHRTPEQALEQVAEAVFALAAKQKSRDRLGAVGVLVPGIVDPASGVCHYSAPLGWHDVAICAPLADRLKVPVVALNRAHAAALGEVAYGSPEGRNLVAIFLDRGIGAGIVSDGQLITGSGGMAGSEIGHVRVLDRGAKCVCGRTGCLATVASGRHIAEHTNNILGRPIVEPLRLADLEGQHPKVDQLLSEAARWLGIAASWLINAVAPDVVILGGPPFAGGSSRFFSEFRRTALSRSLLPDEHLKIGLSRHGCG
jgi:predicted NBD/HSP70 family sugar kinase